jgi:hypothetical protein
MHAHSPCAVIAASLAAGHLSSASRHHFHTPSPIQHHDNSYHRFTTTMSGVEAVFGVVTGGAGLISPAIQLGDSAVKLKRI